MSHVIWSTAEDTRRWYPLDDDSMPTLPGGYKVPNWDGKGEGDRFFAASRRPHHLPVDAVSLGGVRRSGSARHNQDRTVCVRSPCHWAKLRCRASPPRTSAAAPTRSSKTRHATSARRSASPPITPPATELAAGLSEVFGEPVRYQHVPAEVFRKLPFPGADLAANMFQFVAEDNGYGERRDVALTRALNPSLAGFTEWVTATRARMPVHI